MSPALLQWNFSDQKAINPPTTFKSKAYAKNYNFKLADKNY